MKHILVCVKAVPVSSSVEVDGQHRLKRDGASLQWNIADESALEDAFRLADKDGSVTVQDADCPDKICEKHRAINRTGETIICLPHKLVVEIKE